MPNILIFRIVRLLASLISHLYFRVEFRGAENIPTAGPFLMTPNHVSYFDPIWISVPVRRPLRYMTWDVMTRKPLIGPLMRAFGSFPVSLQRADRQALRVAADQLRHGGGLVIFPEGGRTQTGEMMRFKPGAVLLAIESGVPIVPVTIIGAYEAYSFHHLLPRPRKVRVLYHPPIRLTPPSGEEASREFIRAQTARLQEVVASGFDQWDEKK
ncbi:MAG: lysophospholipid acyltransferase family protein [Blastocatellia bacterium]